MEDMYLYRILFFLLCSFIIFHSSNAYDPPDKYFVNCGSDKNILLYGRNFVGDGKLDSLTFSVGKSSFPVQKAGSLTGMSDLYQTARIFKDQSWYDLEISEKGTYTVRLHFYPFSSPTTNLFDAHFNVSASRILLLSNFRIQKSKDNLPLIKEFMLTVNPGNFRIYFTPTGESSLAFVSAIETFLAPEMPDSTPLVSSVGDRNRYYNGLLSQVLHVIYRINVGGDLITPDNDTLGRTWLPDDGFLFDKLTAKRCAPYGENLRYYDGAATNYSAPDPVYKTAQELNITYEWLYHLNITWKFNVKRSTSHFVRVHFCDIIGSSPNATWFNLYIYSNFGEVINAFERVPQLAAPFYIDYVVDSDQSGYMNISVGPKENADNKMALLNGVEIMEFLTDLGPTEEEVNKKRLYIVIGSVVGGVTFVLIAVAVIFTKKYRKTKSVETLEFPMRLHCDGSSHTRFSELTGHGSSVPVNLRLKISFAEIQHATNNFNTKLMIGEGGFGRVYKGTLQNGMRVAVKRSEPGKSQGLLEFQTEVTVLSKIRHRHLVSLIGYCDDRSEMILVYEFMEKGTLTDLLYETNQDSVPKKKSCETKLSWSRRLEICIGAAKGLNYLHTGSGGPIIHRDVKSTNILLDQNYVAKVADFGLSRSTGPLEQSHVSTEVKGSFGYLDPEYFKCLQLTQKSDVYSFGVVLLEVLCARPAINVKLPKEQVNLAEWGLASQRKGQLENIIDPFLVNKINTHSLRKFSETVEKCLKERGVERPSMTDVLWDLEYALLLQQTAVHRESYEDSTTDVSWQLPLPIVGNLPNYSQTIGEDDAIPLAVDYGSDLSNINASEIFSQLKIKEAR